MALESNLIHFKCMPKYETISIIKKLTIIEEISDSGLYYNFYHNNQESVKSLLEPEFKFQTQLRFCYFTYNEIEVKDCAPQHLSISLNGRRIHSEGIESQLKGPIDITAHCLEKSNNVLRIWMDEPNYIWSIPCAFEITFVRCHTPESVFDSIRNDFNKYLSHELTKSLIDKLLGPDKESEEGIEIMNIRNETECSLVCPISGSRIEIACRTTTCNHLQCFDLWSFLKMNDFKYDWFCPICSKPALKNSLRIDKFFNDVLCLIDDSVNAILIKSDYSWIPSKRNTVLNKTLNETITLDDTIDESWSEISSVSSHSRRSSFNSAYHSTYSSTNKLTDSSTYFDASENLRDFILSLRPQLHQ